MLDESSTLALACCFPLRFVLRETCDCDVGTSGSSSFSSSGTAGNAGTLLPLLPVVIEEGTFREDFCARILDDLLTLEVSD